jgi:prevent-host-death family protein
MAKIVTSTELQKNTREIIDWTRTQGESVVIENYGKPMAAILSYQEYQSYLQYRKARAARFDELRKVAAINAAANDLTEEEAIALVESIKQEIFEEQQQSER